MSINTLVIQTLKEVIPDIYPNFYPGKKKKYIVFNLENSNGTGYADDTPQAEDISIQIHIYVKDESPVRYKKEVRKRLFEAGFTYPSIDMEDFEKDTGLHHIALSCEILTNTDLEEE